MKTLSVKQRNTRGCDKLRSNILSAAIISICYGSYHNIALADDNLSEKKEIQVVTIYGEKTERSIQETSSSVQVFDEDKITSLSATEASQLLRLTPNVVNTGYGNNVATIRGIDGSGPGRGAIAFLTGTRPRMNVSVDGRSLTYMELAFGPQSLWDMQQAEVYIGPQSYIQGRNAIAGAMVLKSNDPTFDSESAVKVGMGNQDYLQSAAMLNGAIVEDQLALRLSVDQQRRRSDVKLADYKPAGDSREIETTTVRAKLLLEPASMPNLSTMVTVVHYDTRAPQGENIPSDAFRARYTAERPVFETQSTSGIWDINYKFNDNFSFEANTIYTDFSVQRLSKAGDYPANIDGSELQIEPAIRYQSDNERVRSLVGIRYFNKEQDDKISGMGDFSDQTTTHSVYAEVMFAVTPSVDLTATGRYEKEDRYRKGGDLIVNPTYSLDYRIKLDKSYDAFMPKLAIAWKADRLNTYGASVAKGYRAGGGGVDFITGSSYEFDPESVWNYELFSRHRMNDGTLEITSNIFYNQYDDLQLPNGQTIINIESADTYGAELGINWLATSDLQLFANFGLLKSELKSSAQADVDGNELPRAPAFTTAGGARYWIGDFELSGDVRYTDGYYSYFNNDTKGEVDGYSSVNLQLAYVFFGGRATLFANNVFDSDNPVFYETARGQVDTNSPLLQQARMLGASVELYF